MRYLFIFLLLIFTVIGCNNKNQSSSLNATNANNDVALQLPSDQQVAKAISRAESMSRGVAILGKRKISENEYEYYFYINGRLYYSPDALIHLDNGTWILRDHAGTEIIN